MTVLFKFASPKQNLGIGFSLFFVNIYRENDKIKKERNDG